MILTKELRAEIRRRRQPAEMLDGKLVPGSVAFIRQMLKTVSDPHDRDDLLGELAGEYLRADLEDDHLLVQRERVANHPDAAIMWLGLAHSLSLRNDGGEEAKRAVAKGVEISRQVGTLVRYALTCQTQIARKTGDPVLFAQALRELIAVRLTTGRTTCASHRRRAAAFREQSVQNVVLAGADRRDDLVLIAHGGTVAGRVRGVGGVGIAGARLRVLDRAGHGGGGGDRRRRRQI